MKESGHIQLHTLGKGTWNPQNRRLGRPWGWSGCCEEKILLPVPGIETALTPIFSH